jgi:tricorn protease
MRTLISIILLLFVASSAGADTKLLRFPDLHGDKVVFSYAGDLWIANTSGGIARQLTSHPGEELFAKFSPDGSHIAFTGQYDGGEQVYVIPVSGGEPVQLTWYPSEGPLPARWGYDHQVYGWSPDGSAVLLRSVREGFGLTDSRLYTVKLTGGLPQALPMKVSGAGVFSPDGSQVVFSPLFRDFRTWKRYQGGWAQDLYLFNLDGSGSQNITNDIRTDRDPMWMGDSIYFVSDRDDYLNVYRYDIDNGETSQLTQFRGQDVRWASDDGAHRIVYELNGTLHILDVSDEIDKALDITVPADSGLNLPELVKVADHLEDFDISPNGERVVMAARGEVFSVPVEEGVSRNLTASAGAHDREVAWSPKGHRIAWISDASGEEELYIRDATGQSPAIQVTRDSNIRMYRPVWSPDGSMLAYGDAEARIYVIGQDGKNRRLVGDDAGFQRQDFSWSPDSRWLAYSMEDPNGYRSLYIWDGTSGNSRRITGEMFNEYSPAFSASGEQLYYLSDRMFSPQIGNIEFNYVSSRNTGVFAMMLTGDASNPFAPKNVEGVIEKEDKNGKEEKGGKDKKGAKDDKDTDKTVKVEIDFDGLARRVARAPVDFDDYYSLSSHGDHLLMVRRGAPFYGRDSYEKPTLMAYSLEDRESFDIASGIDGYATAAHSDKVVVLQSGKLNRFDIKKDKQEAKNVDIAALSTERIRSVEYLQIFDEVWRRYRDHFYVRNMHGYDWEALRDQYRPLVTYVADRADLNYLIGEMIAELSAGHTYIAGGDMGAPERSADALLGATFELDESASLYRIGSIYAGQNEEDRYRSPLTEPGIEVSEGDYVLAINGRSLTAKINPYSLLKGAGGKLLELTVAGDAGGKNRHTVIIKPISSENDLIYLQQMQHNRDYVTQQTDGKIGYLHIPDMGASGIYEFIKWYYGQIRKQGLIVDVRGNGGGNVSQMIINRLDRSHVFMGFARGVDNPGTYPTAVFTGPLVGLLDEDSASDGDIFPAAFQALHLGPLIGKRSWGGVVGITNLGNLIDGGNVFVPQFATASAAGEYTIEGTGVSPDIEVDNPPEAVLQGKDPQLDRAIQEAMQRLETQPGTLPPQPADPVKTPGSQ